MSDLKKVYEDAHNEVKRRASHLFETKSNNLEKRMYFLVPYNISPIQQAIQAGHAALEYAHEYKDDPDYIDFIENWKTWIILNGGTTNGAQDPDTGFYYGSLDNILGELCDYMVEHPNDPIKHSHFYEPDLNDALTAICLVVDERVFNREDYPDFGDWYNTNEENLPSLPNLEDYIERYIDDIGIDEKIYFLKELLNNKKLA